MSQSAVLDVEKSNPQIPTSFTADSGTAIPIGNDLEILGSGGITTTGSGKTLTIDFPVPVTVANGGTGTTSLTENGVLVGDGTDPVQTFTLGDGQLLIGDTGGAPVPSRLTEGTGISISNSAGSITISGTSSVALNFAADSGTATPAANTLTLAGTSAQGLTTSGSGSTVTFTISDASTSQKGVAELATDAEAKAVTATDKIITPSNLAAVFAEPPALGSTTPAAVDGTTGTFNDVDVDNLNLNGNTVSTTDVNGDLLLSPNGTGGVVAVTDLTVGNTSRDVSFTINGASIDGTISAEGLGAADLGGIISHRHSATAGFGGHFIGLRSRGTHASPTVVSDGDSLGLFAFAGYDGTDYAQAAQINIQVDGTPGSNDMPGRILFLTSADGGQTPTEAMRISSEQKVGINNPTLLDEFNISGAMDIQHTSTATDDHALEIDIDAAGFGDVKAVNIAYTTGAISGTNEEAIIFVNIDETSATGGEIVGYEVLSTAEGTDTVVAMKVGAQIDPLHHEVGTFGNADSILNIAVDVTAALSSGGAGNISVFVNDNDTMTIGDAATFGEIEVVIDTAASGSGIAPTFRYSTGVGTWSSFTPVDGTNGFRNTGIIEWNASSLTGWATGTGGEYLIEITRTRNSLSTTPIVDLIQIAALTEYMWDKNADITCNSISPNTDITVANGGTGRSTATAYAVICGGTTATGAHQSIASVGTSGQILTSNGAGALPTFQAPVAATDVSDATFRIQDDGDDTREIAFQASGITTSTVRTITMADQDIDLTPDTGTFQAADQALIDISGLAVTNGNFIVGDGANWVAESGQTARDSLGVNIQTEGWSNLGLTYDGVTGVFTVNGYDGTALSSSNPAKLWIKSSSSKGQIIEYTVTANQSFTDDVGTSDIVGNTFGMPTGVAYAEDIPFWLVAATNDDEDTVTFGITRIPHMAVAPASANIGTPASAVADSQGSLFLFSSVTVADYDGNPVLNIGSARGQMSSSDDWTMQAFNNQDGIGKFQEDVLFDVPVNKFSAGTNSHFLDNGGAAPQFTAAEYKYKCYRNGKCNVYYNTTTVSSAGTGSVSTKLLLPFTINDYGLGGEVNIGHGYWDDNSLTKKNLIMGRTSASQLFCYHAYLTDTTAGRNMLNSFYASSDSCNVILDFQISTD
jgi:hypothetical protein